MNPADPSTGLPRQMSDSWIQGRLADAVGPDLAEEILDEGYKRILAKVSPDGSVYYQLIDEAGYVIRGNDGIFIP